MVKDNIPVRRFSCTNGIADGDGGSFTTDVTEEYGDGDKHCAVLLEMGRKFYGRVAGITYIRLDNKGSGYGFFRQR